MIKRFFATLFIFVALIIAFMAFSQEDISEEIVWENTGLFGAEVNEMLMDHSNSQKLFVTSTWNEGLFVTTDGGENWTTVNEFTGGHARGITFDGQGIIYVGLGTSVFKSSDGGTFWNSYQVDPDCNKCENSAIAIDPNDNNTIYVGTGLESTWDDDDTRIYKSTDGGVNWDLLVNLSGQCNDKTKIAALYISSGSSIILATTGSLPWQIDGNIYRSSDSGATWDCGDGTITADQQEKDTWFRENSIVSSDDGTLYAAGGGGVYRSEDEGDTWQNLVGDDCRSIAINNGLLYCDEKYANLDTDISDPSNWVFIFDDSTLSNVGEIRSFAFDPNDVNVIYVASDRGVFKTINNGVTWTKKVNSMTGIRTWSASKSGEMFYVGTDDGLYGGAGSQAAWSLLKSGKRILDIAQAGQKVAFVEWGSQGSSSSSYSNDGGANWDDYAVSQTIQQYIINNGIVFDSIIMSDETVFIGGGNLGGTEGYVLKSTNGGATFSELPSSLFDYPIASLAFGSEGTEVVYVGIGPIPTGVGTNGGMYKSTDGGNSWRQLGLDDSYIVVKIIPDAFNAGIIYAGINDSSGAGKIVKSEDGGYNWSEIGSGLLPQQSVAAIDIYFPDSNEGERVIYVAFGNRIYYSIDSGVNWSYLVTAPYEIVEIILGSLHVGTTGGLYRYTETAPGVDDEGEDEAGAFRGSGCSW